MKLLNTHRVEYLLIGGYAVAYHGYVRTTADIDVWILQTPANAARLSDALCAFGFARHSVLPEIFMEPNRMHRMGTQPLRIEILTTLSGITFADCWPLREAAIIDDLPINVIDIDSLRTNKQASGRPKDLEDLRHLPPSAC